jgi:hypothetical protein
LWTTDYRNWATIPKLMKKPLFFLCLCMTTYI